MWGRKIALSFQAYHRNREYRCEMHHNNEQKCCGNVVHKRYNSVLRWDGDSNDLHVLKCMEQ